MEFSVKNNFIVRAGQVGLMTCLVFGLSGKVLATDEFKDLEQGIVNQLNQERQARGLNQLEVNEKLKEAADLKAQDMLGDNYFAHTSPSGKNPWSWLGRVNYQYRFAGENLAMDFFSVQGVHQAWMKSPTHRENILLPEYTQVGVAVVEGIIENRSRKVAVQFFGQPAEQVLIKNGLEGGKKKVESQAQNRVEIKEVTTHVWPGEKENEVLLYAQVLGEPDFVQLQLGQEKVFLQQLQPGKFLSLLKAERFGAEGEAVKVVAAKEGSEPVVYHFTQNQKRSLAQELRQSEKQLTMMTASVQGMKSVGGSEKSLLWHNLLLAGALLVCLLLVLDVRVLEKEEVRFLDKMAAVMKVQV